MDTSQASAATPQETHTAFRQVLEAVFQQLPTIKTLYHEHGSRSLGEYLRQKFPTQSDGIPETPLQDNFMHCLLEHVQKLHGPALTAQTKAYFERSRTVLTANHHGPDFHALTWQGSLLFSLIHFEDRADQPHQRAGIFPVLAFGNVALNNQSYPRGITLSRHNGKPRGAQDKIRPPRINLFSDKWKRSMMSQMPRYEQSNLKNLHKQIASPKTSLNSREQEHLQDLVDTVYAREDCLAQSTYSDQSSLINHMLWEKVLAGATSGAPHMIYLEIEQITSMMLCREIEHGLPGISRLLFDEQGAERILTALDGVMGCWRQKKLKSILDSAEESAKGSGSCFFWGIDQKKRRYPLFLHEGQLIGRTDAGETLRFEWSPRSIITLLSENTIYPGMFLCFASLALGVGLRCIGGFSQIDYLRQMQKGTQEVFAQLLNQDTSTVDTSGFLVGMIAQLKQSDGQFHAAGWLDTLISGGVTAENRRVWEHISVAQACQFGCLEVYPEITSRPERIPHWKEICDAYYASQGSITS